MKKTLGDYIDIDEETGPSLMLGKVIILMLIVFVLALAYFWPRG